MSLPPLQFKPLLRHRVWGGRRLARLGKSLPDKTLIGESWEVADLPPAVAEDGRSVVAGGPFAGRTLHDLLHSHRDELMGDAADVDGGFPLLIKYLDARENLSVQVHPSPAYAAEHPEVRMKSEAWYIVEAAPGSVIYKGLKSPINSAALRRAIEGGSIVDHLLTVPAVPGECHYLPSGLCHALGAGVLVAEVQTPSDTTFRLFDWGREGRALHIDEALAALDVSRSSSPPAQRIDEGTLMRPDLLCMTDHFIIEGVRVPAEGMWTVEGRGVPVVWMIPSGAGVLQAAQAEQVSFSTGSTVLMPARLDRWSVRFDTETEMLWIRPGLAASG